MLGCLLTVVGLGCAAFDDGDQDGLAACDGTAPRLRAQRTDIKTTINWKSSSFLCLRGNSNVFSSVLFKVGSVDFGQLF